MRRLGPRVPETYPLVEMAAHDCRADRLRRDQIVATGSREFSLDACANISKFTRVTNAGAETRSIPGVPNGSSAGQIYFYFRTVIITSLLAKFVDIDYFRTLV